MKNPDALIAAFRRLVAKPATAKLLLRRFAPQGKRIGDLESAGLFSKVFHTSPVPICIIRISDRRITDVNESFVGLMGYPRDQVIGRTFSQLALWMAPNDRDRALQTLFEQGSVRNVETEIRTRHGESRHTLLSVERIDLNGERYALMYLYDITERRRAEQALNTSQGYARSIIDSSLDMIIAVDMDRRITEFNRAAQATFGYTREEILGKRINLLYADVSQGDAVNQATLLHGHNVQEVLNRRKDGEVFPSLVSASALYDANTNKQIGFMGISRDITQQKRVEEEQRRLFEQVRIGRERLQVLSKRLLEVQESERRHIARELHDEIGQALTGLKFVLQMAARAPGENIAIKLSEAQTLVNELITRVRDLSLELRPAMLDDLGLLPTLLWYLERFTAQTQIRVDFGHSGLERRFAPEIETAGYRIVQEALTNIARHATDSEASVRVWTADDVLFLKVEDWGKGFDVDTTLAASRSGGLTGMRERAILLGGRMNIESIPGVGTRVSAGLPLSGRHLERRERERNDPAGR